MPTEAMIQLDELVDDPTAAQIRSLLIRAGRALRRATACGRLGDPPPRPAKFDGTNQVWAQVVHDLHERFDQPDLVHLLACPAVCDRCIGAALAEVEVLRELIGVDDNDRASAPAIPSVVGRDVEVPDGEAVDDEAMAYERAAGYLGMKRSGLEKLVAQELIPFFKTGDKPKSPVRFRKRELDEWVDNGGAAGARKRRRSQR
jgi:excisionase family DNA binding protein